MSFVKRVKNYSRKSVIIIKNEGVVSFGAKAMQKLQKRRMQSSSNPSMKRQFVSLVDRESVMKADWSNKPYKKPAKKSAVSKTINWVMSPPSSGGGHQNIFRFVELLDSNGYKNNIYIYSTFDTMSLSQARENVAGYCRAKNLTFKRYNGTMSDADAVFATGWETAYPVFNEDTTARKFYFVQDFEPLFYAMGTDYVLAENTYKFGFHGITAGGWLSSQLQNDYGMQCDSYNFGAEPKLYKFTNTAVRKKVFFYARPVTERRGFDLGVMALEIFHKQHPDYEIVLAGWDVSEWNVPFPYTNLKTLKLEELSDVYNDCAAALVLSLTNMSLLPLELLATGTIPVVNDGPNNRLVSDNSFIRYTDASPSALAQGLSDIVTMKNLPQYAAKAAKSVASNSWDDAGKIFLSILEREL